MFFSVLDAKGIYSYASPLGAQSPPGAMSAALNVNADQVGMMSLRRGFNFYSATQFTVTNGLITKLFVYENTLYASFNGGQFAQDDGTGTWTTYGSGFLMDPPAGGFLHQMLAGGNSYFTTFNGAYKLSGINSTAPYPAGSPPALDTQAYVSTVVSSGFLNAQSNCAYEIVWGYTDQSNLLILGAPSEPIVVSNTQTAGPSNNANVSLIFSIPPMVEANQSLPWFYQVYRTPNTGSLTVPPGNNFQLVAQANPQSGDFTNHYIAYTDTTLDILLSDALYTAEGQPSVGQPYGQPPLAQDAAYFQSMAFYANFSTLQNVLVTLDSVGGGAGIHAADTVTITDSGGPTAYTYTALLSVPGDSISGATPATTATALTFSVNINGDGAQSITVDDGGTHTGAHIAAVIQAQIQALTANSAFNQAAITTATATYSGSSLYIITSGTAPTIGFPSSVVVTGAGASTLKLGVANGGTESTGIQGNNPTSRTFGVYVSGTPSVNIQQTAQNLVQVINQDPNNALFTAQYTSAYSALPGQMQIFAQNLSQAFFSVISSRTTCWTPALPSTGTTYASANVTQQNGIAVSNVAMPESWPPDQILYVGSPNFPISRVIPVRTALIVVKAKEGVFEITGTSPSTLTITQLDTTAFISGSETMAPLNNSGYFMTTQGVMLVNESGCEIMSRNIQGDILAAINGVASDAFSVGYQSDNAYIIFIPGQVSPAITSPFQYRYNWITQAWTTWNLFNSVGSYATAAVVNTADDKLYIASSAGFIYQERKNYNSTDYADQVNAIAITNVDATGTVLTLTNSSAVTLGDQIEWVASGSPPGAPAYGIVIANNTGTHKITLAYLSGFGLPFQPGGHATDTMSIPWSATFMPTTCGYPAFNKKFTTWNMQFQNIYFKTCTASFVTDFYPAGESVTLTPRNVTQAVTEISTYSTKNTSVGHWTALTLSGAQAFGGFTLVGYGLFFNFLGERSK